MSKIEKFAQELAYFISKPSDGIEIGGVSSRLVDIIRTQTVNNDKLREKVYEWIEFYMGYDEANISVYKSDYDKLFYI